MQESIAACAIINLLQPVNFAGQPLQMEIQKLQRFAQAKK